jgi:hypothetical protein
MKINGLKCKVLLWKDLAGLAAFAVLTELAELAKLAVLAVLVALAELAELARQWSMIRDQRSRDRGLPPIALRWMGNLDSW